MSKVPGKTEMNPRIIKRDTELVSRNDVLCYEIDNLRNCVKSYYYEEVSIRGFRHEVTCLVLSPEECRKQWYFSMAPNETAERGIAG